MDKTDCIFQKYLIVKEKNGRTYRNTLRTALRVGQTGTFDNWSQAVPQVPGLGHFDIIACLSSLQHISGLANSLRTHLAWKKECSEKHSEYAASACKDGWKWMSGTSCRVYSVCSDLTVNWRVLIIAFLMFSTKRELFEGTRILSTLPFLKSNFMFLLNSEASWSDSWSALTQLPRE